MDRYETLIDKKINVVLDGKVLNSFKFKQIVPTTGSVEGRGSMLKCSCDWEIKGMTGCDHILDFDEQTLRELLQSKKSCYPGEMNLYYEIEEINP